MPPCIEMLLDVQISNEISNDKWYIGQSELVVEQHRIFTAALEVQNALTLILNLQLQKLAVTKKEVSSALHLLV